MVMRTSTERHTYFSEDEKKVAKVYESYEGWFVEFYKDNVLIERRDLFEHNDCLLYTSPSPRDQRGSRMPAWG